MAEKDLSEVEKNDNKEEQTIIPDPSPEFKKEKKARQDSERQTGAAASQPSPLEGSEPPGNVPAPPRGQPVLESEARTWAMLAHLSVLLNLFSGFLGGIAAIVIYFIYKDRSRFVAYHAMQSFIFQSITWIGSGIVGGFLIAIGSAFGILILPLLCLIPGILIFTLIPISVIYGIIGGVQVNNGEDFRYWQVGDWVRDILEPDLVK
jgi:uncharacterized protein